MSGVGLDNFLVDGATVRPLQKARLEMMSGSPPLPRSFSVTTSISLVVTYPPPRNYRRRRFYTSSPTAPHCGTANCDIVETRYSYSVLSNPLNASNDDTYK